MYDVACCELPAEVPPPSGTGRCDPSPSFESSGMVVSLVIVLLVLAGSGFVYESLFGATVGALAYFAGRWRDAEGRDDLEHRNRLIADRCFTLERERDECADYAHRLLEDRSFYREQSALAIETADLRLRGDFGIFSPEVKGRLLS